MKVEDAMELIVLAKGKFLDSPEKYEALQMGKEALEKQISKKPKCNNGWINCPVCDACLNSEYDRGDYCENCGQRLEW